MSRQLLTVAVAILVACASADPRAACETYVASATACIDEAFAEEEKARDIAAATLVGACFAQDELEGRLADDAVVLFDCYTEAYAVGDCSTVEGYTATTTALPDCLVDEP